MDFCPKFHFIYYKNLVECALRVYFLRHNGDFVREGGKYVESKRKSKGKIKAELEGYVCSIIRELMKPYDMSKPNRYFILGSCFPSENILLECCDEKNRIPERFLGTIRENPKRKYVLNESDIEIDIDMYNSIFEDIFNSFYAGKSKMKKMLGEYTNLHFIKHRRLGCYMLWRILKSIYGSSNVRNMYRDNEESMSHNLTSVNEEIEKHFSNKKELVKSEKFGIISKEVKQWTESCVK